MEMNEIKTLTLPVEGMTCASCVARVEKAMKKVDGVTDVNVNFATEKVTFSYNEGATNISALSGIVEDAGYKLVLPAKEESPSAQSTG